ncbi:hypothetical protein [Salininema proteolyticum]|uniref:Phage replication protein O n=1 Tax=Salininema proteolyticum TaxID=1607685 RepID=A0ABV8TT81_9ACTN
MARIRSIKPEFWDSPGIETLAFEWRLLYIAMWNWADDSGRGKAEARELMGFAFPRDEEMTVAEFRRGLGEVRRVYGVRFYKVAGRSYFEIPSWAEHQKIDKRGAARFPGPEEGQPFDPETNTLIDQGFGGDSEESAETTPSPRRDSGAGTGEQGNRGTGELSCAPAPPERDTPPLSLDDSPPKTERSRRVKPGSDRDPDWLKFWDTYPLKKSKDGARKAWAKAIKRTAPADIIAGAERYRDDPGRDPRFTKHPTTWLNQGCWDDEPTPAARSARHVPYQDPADTSAYDAPL